MSDTKIVQRKKDFNIKEGIRLPKLVTERKVGDFYLFIAPEKASFLTTNEFGWRILHFFKDGKTIEQVINAFKNDGIDQETIVSQLHRFLVKVEKKGFYEDAEVTDFHVEQPALHLDLTLKCNLFCPQCFQNAGKERPNELSTEEWLKIIDTFTSKYQTGVCFSGGEPMTHPGIFQILERAKERGLKVTLFSNGTYFTDEAIIKRLSQLVDKIQMSLDGATAEVNDLIRGAGVFNQVILAAKWIDEAGIPLDIAISIMPQNVQDLKNNIESLVKMFGPKVNIRTSSLNKEGRANESHIFASKLKGSQEVREFTSQLYRKHLKILPTFDKNVRGNNCGYGETIVISSTGDVYPCNFYDERTKYGNLRDNDLLEIMEKIQIDMKRVEVENIEICKNCDLKVFCLGGCRLNNIFRNNNLFVPLCTPEHKMELCQRTVDREENDDPITLWLEGAKLDMHQNNANIKQ